MKIFTIKIHGTDHQLKEPIDIEEDVSYSKGKQMFILSNDDFKLLALCRDKEMGRKIMQEEINMMIDSYLFEPNYVVSDNATKLREKIKMYTSDIFPAIEKATKE